MFAIIPIFWTTADWGPYLLAAKKALGRDLLGGYQRSTLASILVSLVSLRDEETITPSEAIMRSGFVLKHASLSFMVMTVPEALLAILEDTDLVVTSVNGGPGLRLAVVTGDLERWKEAVIRGCSRGADRSLRAFTSACLPYLEQQGLSLIWSDYQKEMSPDGTVLLLEK